MICGPTAQAAQAEGSKAWFKRLLVKHSIPTASFEVFSDQREALKYIQKRGAENIVIKADGLMGGKGVTLPNNLDEAKRDLKKLMVRGSPGETILIEDKLVGVERSITAITDGKTTYELPPVQDYKREGEHDTGPNTGGMGAHTVLLSDKLNDRLSAILKRVIEALSEERCPYSGFIYLGFMITADRPMVLECNCRLGDPEAQVILPSIKCNLGKLCSAAAWLNLKEASAPKRSRHALCIVLASGSNPDSSDRDDIITGLDEAHRNGVLIFHGKTAVKNGTITTNRSGRVLSVVAAGTSFAEAYTIAHRAAQKLHFPDMKYRTDIGSHPMFTS